MQLDACEPLLGKRSFCKAGQFEKVRSMLWINAVPAGVCLICVGVGVLHPLAAESAKSARLTICSGDVCTDEEQRRTVMPFHPVTLTISAEVFSVAFASVMVFWQEGWSVDRVWHRLFRPGAILRLWPVGAAYGIGDLMQAFACNSASAPVVLVIGQCKLLLTAVLTMVVFGSRQPAQWGNLMIITMAAIAGANNGASTALNQDSRSGEITGAILAFVKACLSTSGAVFCERFYKEDSDGFWVMSFRVQLLMLATSVIMFATLHTGEVPSSFAEFIAGGPLSLCNGLEPGAKLRCVPLSPGGQCKCVDHVGWDGHTVVAMAAIALNGLVTGLTLKHLSAVGKAICNALSVAVFYPAYVFLGFKPFDLTQAMIISIIIVCSYQYTTKKISLANAEKRDPAQDSREGKPKVDFASAAQRHACDEVRAREDMASLPAPARASQRGVRG